MALMDVVYKDSYRQEKTLSYEKFLSLTPEDRREIEKFEIVPPMLGHASMGGVRVTYKFPHFPK